MPVYEITAPDGSKFEVTAPEGASEQQVLDYARRNMPSREPADPSLASPGNRILKGAKDTLDGGAQLLSHIPGADLVNRGAAALNEALPFTKSLGLTPATSQQIDADIKRSEAQYQDARRAAGQDGIDWLRMAGNAAVTMPVGGPVKAATLAGRTAQSAAMGGAFSAAQPVTGEGDFWNEKGRQAALGAALGGAMGPVSEGVARVISPKTSDDVRALLSERVKLTPGQVLGGAFQKTEDAAMSVPLLGDLIARSRRGSVDSFNRAAYDRALAPIGESSKNLPVGREAIAAIEDKLGQKYAALLPKLNVAPDQQFAQDVASIVQQAKSGMLPTPDAERLVAVIQNYMAPRFANGINGATAKQVMSELGEIARKNGQNVGFAEAVNGLRTSMRDMIRRSNAGTPHADELAAIDQGYANFVRLRDAASRQGSQDGVFTGAQLSAAVRGQDKSKGHGAFAKGDALMQDLSDAGKNVLGQKVPDSGTARRLLQAEGLLAVGHVMGLPGSLTGATLLGASALPYTGLGRAAAEYALARRPSFAEPTADMVRELFPTLGAAALPSLLK